MDALLPPNSGERRTLADIIFSKIEEGETGGAAVIQKVQQGDYLRPSVLGNFIDFHSDHEKPDPALGLDPKVVETYKKSVYPRSMYLDKTTDQY